RFPAAEAAWAELAALPADAPWHDVVEGHNALHAGIVDAAGNRRLSAAHADLVDELAYFLVQLRPHFTLARIVTEHRSLLDILATGDEAAAVAALTHDHAGAARALGLASA